MKKKAFTLLELLVVIAIIGTLTGFFILSFTSANERQQIQLFTDEAYAALQTARTDVSAGKKDEGLICSGLYFEMGELPQKVTFNFEGECDFESEILNAFPTEPEDLKVSGIKVANSAENNVYALFVPPSGDLQMFNERGGELSGAALIELSKGQRRIIFDLDPLANKISVNILDNEE